MYGRYLLLFVCLMRKWKGENNKEGKKENEVIEREGKNT